MKRRDFFKRLGSGAAGAAAAKVLPEPLYADDEWMPSHLGHLRDLLSTSVPIRFHSSSSTVMFTIEDYRRSYDLGPELSKELREAFKDE